MENINISIIDMVIVLSYMVGCVILGFIKFDQIKNMHYRTKNYRETFFYHVLWGASNGYVQ